MNRALRLLRTESLRTVITSLPLPWHKLTFLGIFAANGQIIHGIPSDRQKWLVFAMGDRDGLMQFW